MPSRSLSVVVRQLRAAERDGAGRTDGELLTHFLSRRDDDALATLIERHAPMVWGVCRRLLRNPYDAEDAFQATFLVLVQKAATVIPREVVANWLHGVARQTAVRLRATAAKQGWREVQMNGMPEPAVVEARDEELLSLLDEELSRLPERFRALIVRCDLEGHTRKEVARQLGCPEGTVASGLARAREQLAKRLIRRGLAVSVRSVAATLSQSVASADVPATVVTSAINVATLLAAGKAAGVISNPVATLTQGVLKTMFLKKIMTTAVAVLGLGVAVITGGGLVMGQIEQPVKAKVGQDVKPPGEKPLEPAAKQEKDKEGFTAWGKEVNGVQIGIQLGEPRAYQIGEDVTLILRIRNNGKEAVPFRESAEYFEKNPPNITDTDGKAVTIKARSVWGFIRLNSVAPGKEADLVKLRLALQPATDREKEAAWTLYGTGKFQIQYPVRDVVGEVRLGSPGMTLTTGKLELEVRDKPPVAEKKPMDAPAKPKPEARKVYTPDEVMREKYDAAATRTVEFKVRALAKPTEVKQSPGKDSQWVTGHGPDDVNLLPQPPKKFEEEQFSAILTSQVVEQLKRIGIKEVGKHFDGKTIRISGRIRQHNYSGDDPPVAPHYDLVIEDVSQFDAVD